MAAILLVDGATNVTIANLTIDGSVADHGANMGNCTVLPFYTGIDFKGGSGTIDSARVTGITSAKACADAIRAESANLVVTRSLVDNYGRTGITCSGQNANCTIIGNAIRGLGPVNNQGQAGLQILFTAAAEISGNIITDNFFLGATGAHQFSVGIFLAFAQPTSNGQLLLQNVFANNQLNVQRLGSAAANTE